MTEKKMHTLQKPNKLSTTDQAVVLLQSPSSDGVKHWASWQWRGISEFSSIIAEQGRKGGFGDVR